MNLKDLPDALPAPPPSPTSPLSDRNDHETRARILWEKYAGVRQGCSFYSQFNLKG